MEINLGGDFHNLIDFEIYVKHNSQQQVQEDFMIVYLIIYIHD